MINNIKFVPITFFSKGLLYTQLVDAYSFDERYKTYENNKWLAYDNFFFDNPIIAQKYGFVTTFDGIPIGHITWDPRNLPKYVEIGHNCIISKYKGNGFGKLQLQEAIKRIKNLNAKKIMVTTNNDLVPAQKNYESAGFRLIKKEKPKDNGFIEYFFYYELKLN